MIYDVVVIGSGLAVMSPPSAQRSSALKPPASRKIKRSAAPASMSAASPLKRSSTLMNSTETPQAEYTDYGSLQMMARRNEKRSSPASPKGSKGSSKKTKSIGSQATELLKAPTRSTSMAKLIEAQIHHPRHRL